jgi:hypothetical protein
MTSSSYSLSPKKTRGQKHKSSTAALCPAVNVSGGEQAPGPGLAAHIPGGKFELKESNII